MTVADLLVLAVAGIAAGIVSTVAALASLVSYPVLLALGLPPLSANVTNTVSLSFTAVGAAAGSRPELAGQAARLRRLGLVTALGGAAGAAILLLTPARTFESAAPVLIGGASLVLLLQPSPRDAARGADPAAPAPARDADPAIADPAVPAPDQSRPAGPPRDQSRPAGPPRERSGAAGSARERSKPRLAMLFLVAVYVGYFGAAGGILMLAVLIPMLSQSLARTNAVKNVINGLANGGGRHRLRRVRPGPLGGRAPAGRRFSDRRVDRPGAGPPHPRPAAADPDRAGRHRPGHPARPERLPLTRTATKPTYVGYR